MRLGIVISETDRIGIAERIIEISERMSVVIRIEIVTDKMKKDLTDKIVSGIKREVNKFNKDKV